MYRAANHTTNKQLDQDMLKLAWQTTHILNACGRLKKQIKPTDLYVSNFATKPVTTEEHSDTIEDKKAELRAIFNLE